MKTKINLIIVFVIFINTMLAQQQKYSDELYREYLDGININDLETNFILNRGFVSEDEFMSLDDYLEKYEEETNEVQEPVNVKDPLSWMKAYEGLCKSEVNTVKKLPVCDSIMSRLKTQYTNLTTNVPILVYDVVGELLNETEIENSINGNPKNQLYKKIHLFGGISLYNTFYKKKLSFNLDTINYFTNLNNEPSTIYIDFSDGRGIQSYSPNSGTININYSSLGEKVITVYRDANLGGNNLRIGSAFTIDIKGEIEAPSQTLRISSNSFSDDTITASGGEANIFYGDDGVLDKPIIIVQGFDPVGDITFEKQFDKYETFFNNEFSPNGYDMVFITLNNTNLELQSNVTVVKELLKQVNSAKSNNFESVVIGESMGGLLSRIAIRELENENYDHEVGVYVSFDAPHQGANLPPGLLHTFQDAMAILNTSGIPSAITILDKTVIALYNLINSLITGTDHKVSLSELAQLNMAHKALTALNSKAAKSMLVRHINPGNYFSETQDHLNETGYPQLSRNIALVNGSNNNDLQTNRLDETPFTSLGDKLLRMPIWRSDCNEFSFDAWTSSVNRTQEVSRITTKVGLEVPVANIEWRLKCWRVFRKRFCTNVPRVTFSSACLLSFNNNSSKNYTFDAVPYDNAPGSTLPGLSGLPFTLNYNTCFVPTASAIDLSDTAYNSSSDPMGLRAVVSQTAIDNFIVSDEVPFDEVYSEQANSVHVYFSGITNLFNDIISQEIMPSTLAIQDKIIENDRNYEADTIVIGNDVNTVLFPSKIINTGDVIVNSGVNLDVAALTEITITDGTHVEEGADAIFRIDNTVSLRQEENENNTFEIAIIGDNIYNIGEVPSFKGLVSDISKKYNYSWKLLGKDVFDNKDEFFIEEPLMPGMYTVELDVISRETNKTETITKVFEVKAIYEDELESSLQTELFSENITVYPNPTKNEITIISKSKIKKIVITDMKGALIDEFNNIERSWKTLSLEQYQIGAYLVKSYFKNNIVAKKIIKK